MGHYTAKDLDNIDEALFRAMRTTSAQQVINIAMPIDPPRFRNEYGLAIHVTQSYILQCQPLCGDSSVPGHLAFRVIPECQMNPIQLIGFWARLIILPIALGDLREGIGNMFGTLETACQYRDDSLLLAGVKLSFAAVMPLLGVAEAANDLVVVSGVCQKILTNEREEHCARYHGKAARELGTRFYEILYHLAIVTEAQSKAPAGKYVLRTALRESAIQIDKATKRRFQMETWLSQKYKALWDVPLH